jgi:uncharacterized protein (TIGR03067 family)
MAKCPFLTGLIVPVMVSGVLVAERPLSDKKAAVKAELKRLEGQWRIVAAEQGGQPVEANDIVVFSDHKCTVTNPTSKVVWQNSLALDPSRTPKHMEVTNTKTKQQWRGIYELKGDRLRVVFQGNNGGKRPTEFKTRSGSREVMYTYERVKPR